jgi:hypothetical protein
MATHAAHAAASHGSAKAETVADVRRRAWEVLAGLSVVAAGCLAAIIALVPSGFSSNDSQLLAILALLGGALGAAISAIVLTCDRYSAGVELADGTTWPAREKPIPRFNERMVPFLVLRPVLGAVMGLLVYAGFVGGYLISTTKAPEAFSPQGLVFTSVLSGLFAKTFLARVRLVFKALLGDQQREDTTT